MNKWILVITCLQATILGAQQMPGTEIYLFDLKKGKSGLVLSNPKNITAHPGYDNQPFFHPGQPVIYYVSANAEQRTDIFSYNYESGATAQITKTNEREFSPTITPDNAISCIIQRDSGQQDLGVYPIGGGDAKVLINTLTIGYHAWADHDHVFVFAIDGDTVALRLYYIPEKKEMLIADNIGRSLHHIPGTSAVSFVHKVAPNNWLIKRIEEDGSIAIVTETLKGREDLTWTTDGKIIMSDGQKLFVRNLKKNKTWSEIEMQSSLPVKGITRLAVNSRGTKVAIVVSE